MISDELMKMITEERIRQGLTLQELSERAGCSERILEYWEQGKRRPTEIETVDKVLKALNLTYTLGGDKRAILKSSGIMAFSNER